MSAESPLTCDTRVPVWVRVAAWMGPALVLLAPLVWVTGAVAAVTAALGVLLAVGRVGLWLAGTLSGAGAGTLLTAAVMVLTIFASVAAAVGVAQFLFLVLNGAIQALEALPNLAARELTAAREQVTP